MTSPTNDEIGQLIGVTHATVSRYKSGDRLPTIDVMGQIAEAFKWSMDDQYAARQAGTYASEFSQRVAARAAVGALGENAATNQQGRGGQTPAHPSTQK